MNKVKYIVFGGLIIFGILIISLVYQFLYGKGNLEVLSPIDGAQFIFENQVYYTPAKIKNVSQGKHIIYAHNSGYKDETREVKISGFGTAKITLKMEPLPKDQAINDVEKDWQKYFEQEGKKANEEIKKRENNYPLTKYLPYFTGNIMFDYEVSEDGSVNYFVSALPNEIYLKKDYEDNVDRFIRSKGFEPSIFSIEWK